MTINDEYTEEQWKNILRTRRVAGDAICNVCKKPYRKHPVAKDILSYDGSPFLRIGCEDDLLKL